MTKIKIAFISCCLLATFTLVPLQADQAKPLPASIAALPDTVVPLNNWVYPAFDKMEDIQGILGCSLFRRQKTQTYTRHTFAICALRWREQSDWRYVEKFPQGKLLGEAGVKDIIAAFEREFQPEITQIISPPK